MKTGLPGIFAKLCGEEAQRNHSENQSFPLFTLRQLHTFSSDEQVFAHRYKTPTSDVMHHYCFIGSNIIDPKSKLEC